MKDHELFSLSTGLLRTECDHLPFDFSIAQLVEHYKSGRRISNKARFIRRISAVSNLMQTLC